MKDDDAIVLRNISKTFRISHERSNSISDYFVSFLKRRTFEEIKIIDDISFSVKKGEMLGVIGFNGSGKTTLLKIMARIYSPDQGNVVVNGNLTPLLELGTGFRADLTARENIITYGTLLGFSKKEIRKKIDKITRFAELEDFLDTKINNFSTGMTVRLGFATAMEVNPDILLVDEVLSVGDVSFQEKSFNTFLDFKKQGKTIVFVSHNLAQIEKLCDRVLWIHGGKIREFGKSSEVIAKFKKFSNNMETF